MNIDFDDILTWGPTLSKILYPFISKISFERISNESPEYIEDSLEIIFQDSDKENIINETLKWLYSIRIIGYHGTRLIEQEMQSIKVSGIHTLKASDRIERLTRTLSAHPKWEKISHQLPKIIKKFTETLEIGKREGQAHLTLSRFGLISDFNHYLQYGSEFDQRVAAKLLGSEGIELLANYGDPVLIKVSVPGKKAIEAANPYKCLRGDDLLNILNEILCAWSFWLFNPNFRSTELRLDCGMIFNKTIPAVWIMGFEKADKIINYKQKTMSND